MTPAAPLAKKLGIKANQRVLVIHAPEEVLGMLEPLPEGAAVETSGQGPFDVVLVFVRTKSEAETYSSQALSVVKPGGLLWFAYPKKSSAAKTDISRDVGWDTLNAAGFRPVSLVAIDQTWAALRFRPASDVKARRTAKGHL